MSDQPPPYIHHPPGGPSAPGFTSAYSFQPASFPGSPYQTFPQANTGEGDHAYYHGPLGPVGPPGPYLPQPGYQGHQSQTTHPWGGPNIYGETPKQTVFMVGQDRGHSNVGGKGSCLTACLAALCCCCLWDMLASGHH
ncbi:cysteine-rich and transmembrane domain-containing protein 1-like [Micropterus salmoides]|uniref:cysteine-rich and transmembrane domain-containing protein 1-like n=1 Tax=Micropterus salmoides TaxID=27706 RepID=UPI0018ED2A28|nr:cysteine-rich and transmembrane domain-containing protein 1-like [Micropterus salmoides]